MRIAIDLDGTLVNTLQKWINAYNKKFKKYVQYNDIKEYDFPDDDWWGVIIGNPEVHTKSKPFPHAIETILKMSLAHDILFITACHPKNYVYKMILLEKLFPNINYSLHFTQSKWFVDWDVLIEDSPHIPTQITTNQKVTDRDRLIILLERPYNIKYRTKTKVKHFDKNIFYGTSDDWRDTLSMIHHFGTSLIIEVKG